MNAPIAKTPREKRLEELLREALPVVAGDCIAWNKRKELHERIEQELNDPS